MKLRINPKKNLQAPTRIHHSARAAADERRPQTTQRSLPRRGDAAAHTVVVSDKKRPRLALQFAELQTALQRTKHESPVVDVVGSIGVRGRRVCERATDPNRFNSDLSVDPTVRECSPTRFRPDDRGVQLVVHDSIDRRRRLYLSVVLRSSPATRGIRTLSDLRALKSSSPGASRAVNEDARLVAFVLAASDACVVSEAASYERALVEFVLSNGANPRAALVVLYDEDDATPHLSVDAAFRTAMRIHSTADSTRTRGAVDALDSIVRSLPTSRHTTLEWIDEAKRICSAVRDVDDSPSN